MYPATADLLTFTRAELPQTAVGISVLASADENYTELAALCPDTAFCELNLKYSLRLKPDEAASAVGAAKQRFDVILAEAQKLAAAFKDKPIFVKLPREAAWLVGSAELNALLDALQQHGKAGLIVANSRRMNTQGCRT